MRILALETSAKAVSAAITEDGRLLAAGYQDTGLTHSRTLMPVVEHLLRNTGLTLREMDAVAAAAGPGSFTGIRIGISAAKGLAFSAEKPAVGVSTLAAMARNVSFAGGLIVCAMDARRNQIYNALFEGPPGAAEPPRRLAPPHLVMQCAASVALEAEHLAAEGGLVSAQDLAPVYLRPPQAVRLRERQE